MFRSLKWIYENYTMSNLCDIASSRVSYYIENSWRTLNRLKKDEKVNLEEVDAAIERGRRWLEDMQRNDGSIGDRHWEIWETANATLALMATNKDSKSIEPAINFILGGQLDNGGFFVYYLPSSEKEKDLYCIETTSVVLTALYRHEEKLTPEIKKGIDFILEKQHECGGWGLPYIGDSQKIDVHLSYYPSVTGYALQAILLSTGSHVTSAIEKAIEFLGNSQRKNGSWGRSPPYYNTGSYAIKNISNALVTIKTLELMGDKKLKIEKMLSSCISYAKNKQNAEGSWSSGGPSSKLISTSLFLQSLLNVNEGFIGSGVNWLIEHQQKEGFWHGGILDGYNVDVFATSEALIALSKFREAIIEN